MKASCSNDQEQWVLQRCNRDSGPTCRSTCWVVAKGVAERIRELTSCAPPPLLVLRLNPEMESVAEVAASCGAI
jgi:hypothetical protein